MRFVKENSTHAEVVRSCLKKQTKLAQKTADFATQSKFSENRAKIEHRKVYCSMSNVQEHREVAT